MITIKPKTDYTLNSPGVDSLERDKLIRELTQMLHAPFLNGVVVHNQTKTCLVTLAMDSGVIHIRISNPNDEVFNVEDEG